MKTIIHSGYDCYVVGGAVRDFLMGNLIKDFDLTTSASPEVVRKLFPRVVPLGIKHGTVTVIVNGFQIEITTFRNQPAAVNKLSEIESLKRDLAARDFTLNSIAWTFDDSSLSGYSLSSESICGFIDPFDGSKDISDKILRVTGDNETNFIDDPLRILRGCRMAGDYDLSVDPLTLSFMRKHSSLIHRCAVERILSELKRIFLGSSVVKSFRLIFESGLGNEIFSGNRCLSQLENNFIDYRTSHAQTLRSLGRIFSDTFIPCSQESRNLLVGLSIILYHSLPEEEQISWLKRMKLPVILSKNILLILKNAELSPVSLNSLGAIRKFYSQFPAHLSSSLILFWKGLGKNNLDSFVDGTNLVLSENPCLSVKDLAIDGKTLMRELGIKSGPEVGVILNQLLEYVVDDPENNQHEVLLTEACRIYNCMT